MARTTARTQAREAAAKRQEAANAARTEYDTKELETLTRLDLARHRRDEAAENLAAAEREMANEIEHLFGMGNSLDRVLTLSGESDKDTIKRMRKLAGSSHESGAESQASRTSGSGPARTIRQVNADAPVPSPEPDDQSVSTTLARSAS